MSLPNVDDIFALTPVQEGMLYHTISDPASGVYVDQVCKLFTGPLQPDDFKQAWDDVMTRHAALRTAFLWDGLDSPLQVQRTAVEVPWKLVDLRSENAEQCQTFLMQYLQDDRRKGFDLSQAPLMRMLLLREQDESWRWIWSVHHILADGWSGGVIFRELFERYALRQQGQPPPVMTGPSYRKFAAWHEQQNHRAAEQFWQQQLSGFRTPVRLPVMAFSESADSDGTQQLTAVMSVEETDQLKKFARANLVTTGSVVHAMWAFLLSRYSGETDVVFGTTVAGRPAELPDVGTAVGLYINTLPVRLQCNPSSTVTDWLQEVQTHLLNVREFGFSALASVQKCSDVPSGQRLFDSLVAFENYPDIDAADACGSLTVKAVGHYQKSNFPLALIVVPECQLQLLMIFDAATFPPSMVEQILENLRTLLRSLPDSANSTLMSLSMHSEREQQLLQSIAEPKQLTSPSGLVHDLIDDHAARFPDSKAVSFQGTDLTYSELTGQANAIAQQLQARGAGPNSIVGLYSVRSVEMIVGMLGILKSGAAYVPLDATYPDAHIAAVAQDAAIRTVVVAGTVVPDALQSCDCLHVDSSVLSTPIHVEPVRNEATGRDLAYVLYTSGSTGRPRGVLVTHDNLMHSTRARFSSYPDNPERFLLMSSMAFDSSVAGIFWTLCTGGTLVIPAPGLEQNLTSLTSLIQDKRITHTLVLPSLYRVVLQESDTSHLQSLNTVIVAGEACQAEVCRLHFNKLPHSALYNEYGPTEATVWSTVARVSRDQIDAQTPIGGPVPGTGLQVLDANLRPTGIGIPGELFVTGPGVARGYLNRPDETAARFIDLPGVDGSRVRAYRTGDIVCLRPDGELLFLGRMDRQVKIRGFRIEPGEIEEHLCRHEAVNDAVVRAVDQIHRTADEEIAWLAERMQQLPTAESEKILQELESEVLL